MTIIRHELRQSLKPLIIWTTAIAFLILICVIMFPEMKEQMGSVNDMFSSMGSFTEAFGMDRLNFGTFLGFYAVECGNILGIGGAFFAAFIGVSVLAKEEKDHTAEFLLAHPISRKRVITEKLIAVMIQILVMNVIAYFVSIISTAGIGEEIPWKMLTLLHVSYLIMQVELCGICFGISGFLTHGSIGIGLGIAALMYFLNIIGNLTDSAKFLKYITPFGYTEGADIVSAGKLDGVLIACGMSYAIIAIVIAYIQYCRKDIR